MTDPEHVEQLVRMASAGLRLDPPPEEAEIDEMLLRLASVFHCPASAVEEARKRLHANFAIRMQPGQTIKRDHQPWLDARRGGIDPFYWSRYRQLLLNSDWPPLVVGTLDRSMDELLDLLGNPAIPEGWGRRGLVVGDVQSGKTASYAALLCKAADAGYRMIILLTGTLENVRRQTQRRLDAAFVGLDSRDFLAKRQLKQRTLVGVGHINGSRTGVVFTSQEQDFRKTTATALKIALDAVREPVLVVTKKNKRVLTSLAGWLRANNAVREQRIDLPLLLIDDEADNASINTKKDPQETTAINAAIRDLLSLFTRSSYVGFTATPFANIFIDPDSSDQMLGDDLFPRDFIHLLEAPGNYVGMPRLFPSADPEQGDPDDEAAWSAGLRAIADCDDWLPVDHKSGDRPGDDLPESLRRAVRHFLISCAVRDVRSQTPMGSRDRGIHRSMLVNVSRFTAIQDRVAEQLHEELRDIQNQIRLYGRLPAAVGEANSAEMRTLHEIFESELPDCDVPWSMVASTLNEAASPVRVQPVNQRTGAASLDYDSVDEPPGFRVIAVGGNSLSRGLTLEGLSVSYFLRNSKAYDTLLQMGRWFGYRDGYDDLCRVWLTEEAEGWYRHITDATSELKRDFTRMRKQGGTPADFGLRVRSHPGTLLITARNKMATGMDVVGEVRDIALDGRGIETARLHAAPSVNGQNLRAIDRFLVDLIGHAGAPSDSPNGVAKLWHAVPGCLVARLLDDFLVHPLNNDFQGDAIAEAIRRDMEHDAPRLATWTVALPTDGTGPLMSPPLACGVVASLKKRRVLLSRTAPPSLLVSGRKARVGSRLDVRHGLSMAAVREVETEWRAASPGKRDVPEDAYRAKLLRPMLVVYLLHGVERDYRDRTERVYPRSGDALPALALHFPGEKRILSPEELSRRYIKYRLNRVAQMDLEADGEDLVDDDDD